MSPYDVVTFGETMLRLTPPDHLRLEQAPVFEAEVGGSESNTSVGLARLGLRVAWVSRLPRNPLGLRIARTIAGHGVDVSHVAWADDERLGLYFVEFGVPPREAQVIYDRRDSAFSHIQPEHLPDGLFQPGEARLLHLSGITPGLSASAAAAALSALQRAKEAGWLVSFDLNYRARLWLPEAARAGCEPFARAADILFMPLRDARLIYGIAPAAPADVTLRRLAARFPQATVILTLGGEGALASHSDGQQRHQPAFPASAVDVGRIGGGDAFTAGVLYGRLTAPDGLDWLGRALLWGTAAAALKYTIPGDLPLIERAEVERLMASASEGPALSR